MWAESCKQSCSLLLYCLVVNCETRTLYNTLKPRWRQYDDSQHNGWTRSQFVWLCIDLSLFSTIKSKKNYKIIQNYIYFLQELDFEYWDVHSNSKQPGNTQKLLLQYFLNFQNNLTLIVILLTTPLFTYFSGDIRPELQDERELRPDEHLTPDVQHS